MPRINKVASLEVIYKTSIPCRVGQLSPFTAHNFHEGTDRLTFFQLASLHPSKFLSLLRTFSTHQVGRCIFHSPSHAYFVDFTPQQQHSHVKLTRLTDRN